ncbi:hypothetical protein J2D73_20475, partial [Acetobacter sacchari]
HMMSPRNFSLPQLQSIHTAEARLLAEALKPDTTFNRIEIAANMLRALCESGHRGDAANAAQCQQLLYILSLSDDVATA